MNGRRCEDMSEAKQDTRSEGGLRVISVPPRKSSIGDYMNLSKQSAVFQNAEVRHGAPSSLQIPGNDDPAADDNSEGAEGRAKRVLLMV